MEVVTPGFKGPDHSKEFSVINVIVPFCKEEGLEQIGSEMPLSIDVSLKKDST